MAGKNDMANVMGDRQWYSALMEETFHTWDIRKPWRPEVLRNHGLALSAFSAKASNIKIKGTNNSITRKNPLHLQNGFVIESGYSKITTQNMVISVQNVRVDSVIEANEVLKELHKLYPYGQFEILRLELYNAKVGATIIFTRHNPNGAGTSLYLWKVIDSSGDRDYHSISYYEQQRLCGQMPEKIAVCEMATTAKPHCALLLASELKKLNKTAARA
jgi:hypothetical protein